MVSFVMLLAAALAAVAYGADVSGGQNSWLPAHNEGAWDAPVFFPREG